MLKQYVLFAFWVYHVSSDKCKYHVIDSSAYVGCFVDTDDRLLPYWMFDGSNTDNNRCILNCRNAGYMYAGTEDARYCFCGNDPWKFTADDVATSYIHDYDCDHVCSGNSTQICGGDWRLSVYRTGVKNDTSQTIQSGKVERKYIKVGEDKNLDGSITAIASLNAMSTIECGRFCSVNESCTGFVYSTITGTCQLYWLKYQDLCSYTHTQGGSSVYMID